MSKAPPYLPSPRGSFHPEPGDARGWSWQSAGMRPVADLSSADYRSPQWVQRLGQVIECMGLWPAIAVCTLLAATGAVLVTLLISLFLTPDALARPMLIAALVTTIVTPPISYAVFRLLEDLTLTRKALRQIANHDGLTQAHSRRFFMS